MKLLTLIIWLIGFPLATKINRYYTENIKRILNQPKTTNEMLNKIEATNVALFVVMIIIIILS